MNKHKHKKHGKHKHHKKWKHKKRMEIKEIIFWVVGILVVYFIVTFIFFPADNQKVQNLFSQAGSRYIHEKAIDMNHDCDFSSAAAFGYSKKEVIKMDCDNVCGKEGLKYASYGCPGDRFTCYCN